jgi:SAM-dependent methyltransferase
MHPDNLIEYAEPWLYDLENDENESDVRFIQSVIERTGSPVLELGCGTGRLTLPLARSGVEITGLDVMPGMLERARQKAGTLAVRWILADARSFHLEDRFRLIFEAGSVFQHMLTRTDQESFLACVREHLTDQGMFLFGSFFPCLDILENVDEEQPWFTTRHPDGWEIRVSGTECYDALRQVKVETATRRWTDGSGREHLRMAPLALRYTFPQELETLLHYNGFEIVDRYGDTRMSPLANDSRLMITLCRKRQ